MMRESNGPLPQLSSNKPRAFAKIHKTVSLLQQPPQNMTGPHTFSPAVMVRTRRFG